MEDKKSNEQSLGKFQIKTSIGIIDVSKRTTDQEILAIKLKNEAKQKQTRQEEAIRQTQRAQEIMDEAKSSAKNNAALEMQWNQLKDLEECEELNKQIEEQNRIFKEILSGKNKLIKEFWDELKKKDDDYVKMLKEQSDDIKIMIEKMRLQFTVSRENYLRELDNIEHQFEIDRRNLFDQHQEELKHYFDRHRDAEEKCVQKHIDNDDQNNEKIEELRIKGAKDFANLKIQMEGEIQNLEKCLEDMKALYILNTEKLGYNLQVLKEKHEENVHLCEELKRKDINLNNRLRKLTKEYIEKDREFKKRNKILTGEYKRITRQFKELQKKFKHFEKADLDRYGDIQKMNEEEVRKYKDKIIKCDITIHIQQLGTQWKAVEQEDEETLLAQKRQAQLNNEKENEQDQDEKLIVSEQKLGEIVAMLLEEADFLINDKIREELAEQSADQQTAQKLESIKKCIGIDSIEEMNMFVDELIRKCRIKNQVDDLQGGLGDQQEGDKQEEKKEENQKKKKDKKDEEQQAKEEEKQLQEHEIVDLETAEINQNEVVKFLRHWLADKDARKIRLEQMSTKKQVKQESEREKKERIAREGKKYWEKLTQVLPDRTFRVWRVLEKALSKYYKLLLTRQKLIEETGELHNQNEELKNLLNQYLQINHELQIPPTRLINLEPENK